MKQKVNISTDKSRWMNQLTDKANRSQRADLTMDVPITMVSSGISSIKHFFSVSPMWK